jgi:ribokinase
VRFAVVGHIEWVEFLRVDRLPAPGQIAHGSDPFEEPAGGGGVAAVQLARLGGEADLFTALGEDHLAGQTRERLGLLGVSIHAALRDGPTRRAITQIDAAGERTITTIGERLAPRREDPLPWDRVGAADGAYFTAGDAGALEAARGAGVLVATPRAGAVLVDAGVELDALVYSESDELERAAAKEVEPRAALVVATEGARGGTYRAADGDSGRWQPAEPPGPIADSYGAGDSFAAALCWALASGRERDEALRIAALAGATCMAGRGPYDRQLTGSDVR